MGNMASRFLNIMKLNSDDGFDEMIEENILYQEEEQEEEEQQEKHRFPFFHGKKQEEEVETIPEPVPAKTTRIPSPAPEPRRMRGSKKVSNIVPIERGEEVKVVRPQSLSEARVVSDYLKANKTVILNMEGIEVSVAQRIVDFVGGTSYALEGSLEQISSMILLIAPKDVEVSGDLRTKISSESFISPDLGSL